MSKRNMPQPMSTTSAARKRGGTRRPPLPPLLPLPLGPVQEDVSEPPVLQRRATLRRNCAQRVEELLLLLLPPLLLLLPSGLQRRSRGGRRVWQRRRRSAEASASDATTRRGTSPAECRTVRSLRCGPGSRRLPGRTPGSGGFCARRPTCFSCSTPSLVLVTVFSARRPSVRGVHPWERVVGHRYQRRSHRLLLVSQPRAQTALPSPLRGTIAINHPRSTAGTQP